MANKLHIFDQYDSGVSYKLQNQFLLYTIYVKTPNFSLSINETILLTVIMFCYSIDNIYVSVLETCQAFVVQ